MATLHGFPVLLAGRRLCIVDMPDCWGIMNSLDTFPQAAFRFPKDEAGWRDAVAQLQRSDVPEPAFKRAPVVASQGVITNPRRQFSVARIGIFVTAAVLAATPWQPWAVVHHGPATYKGDLFAFMDHGWRQDVAWMLVGLAALGALQAVVLPFGRVKLVGSLCGIVTLVPVILGITQIHTFDPAGLPSPHVAVGLGAWVALGACGVLVLSWALFPTKLRRSPPVRRDLLGEYGVVNSFSAGAGPGVPTANGIGDFSVATPGRDSGPQAPPAAAGRYVKQPEGPGGRVLIEGLPTLGAALTTLAQHGPIGPADGQTPDGAGATGAADDVATWSPPSPMDLNPVPMPVVQSQPPPTDGGHPAGWYADYRDTGALRWWDGRQWTEHTHPAVTG